MTFCCCSHVKSVTLGKSESNIHVMKAYRWSVSMDQLILNIGTECRLSGRINVKAAFSTVKNPGTQLLHQPLHIYKIYTLKTF